MDGLTLLRRARDAGLAVAADGDKLVIRRPKRAEPVARLLIEHKPDVLAALAPIARAAQRWHHQICCADLALVPARSAAVAGSRGARLWRRVEQMASASRPALAAIAVRRM